MKFEFITQVYAQSGQQMAAQEAHSFVERLNDAILFPIIGLLAGVAFLVFLWGCVEFVMGAANDQRRAQGQQHVLWGIIGLVVMFSAWAILTIAAGTFGLNQQLDCANDPSGAGCETIFTPSNPG